MTSPRDILTQLQAGAIDIDGALASLRLQPATDLGFARIDHERASRCGFPEVVFCQGKTPAQAAAIAVEILTRSDRVLLTRAEADHADAVRSAVPDARWHATARCLTVRRRPAEPVGLVAVVAAGTADLPVAEEAAVTLEIADNRVERHVDVGVAGLHRLLDRLTAIRRAHAVVAVAGMEGALPSVLGGLLARPVFAVPTSVGYGTSFGGLTALLAMLNSCAAGVAVVNVDNGFGAGYLASLVNRQTCCQDPDDARMTPR